MGGGGSRARILVNAAMHPDGLKVLEAAGFETVVVLESDPEGSHREAPGAVGMVANASLPIDDAFLAKAPQLRVVGRMGVGYDNVDTEALRRRGVRLVNTPLPVIEPVAEHTLMLMLALARRLLPGDRAVREGRWRTPETLPGPELRGKTLGVIGFGNTGRRVAEIAALGFGMKVLYFDQAARPEAEQALGAARRELHPLLGESDFVSLHLSLTPATRGFLGAREFGAMKPGAYFINLARGPVVDEAALLEALRTGRLAGAGLDVFTVEPPRPDNPLLGLPNVVLAPHVGGASTESKRGCSMVAEDVVRVLRGEAPRHLVC
jgi:glyoxylate reductase